MPHKRAKRSARETDKTRRGEDLAPNNDSLNNEPIPKSVSRVLNAAKIREDWRAAKRKLEDGDNNKQNKKRRKPNDIDSNTTVRTKRETEMSKRLVIKPGESIQHFNRRVEDDMRPLVKSAVHASNHILRGTTRERKATKNLGTLPHKDLEQQQGSAKSSGKSQPAHINVHEVKEFQKHSSSAPRRLNDVAQAPPEFKKLPRGAAAISSERGSGAKREGILSMSQKEMMEKERENAIVRYREMRAQQKIQKG